MSLEGLLNVENYQLKEEDNSKVYSIYRIGIVHEYNNLIVPDTSAVALITERLKYKVNYVVTVTDVKDKSGNWIAGKNKVIFSFPGYAPDKIQTPNVQLVK